MTVYRMASVLFISVVTPSCRDHQQLLWSGFQGRGSSLPPNFHVLPRDSEAGPRAQHGT